MEFLFDAQRRGVNLLRRGSNYELISLESSFEGKWFLEDPFSFVNTDSVEKSLAYKVIKVDGKTAQVEIFRLSSVNEPVKTVIPKPEIIPGHYKIDFSSGGQFTKAYFEIDILGKQLYLKLTTEKKYEPAHYCDPLPEVFAYYGYPSPISTRLGLVKF